MPVTLPDTKPPFFLLQFALKKVQDNGEPGKLVGKISFIDLAGSERGAGQFVGMWCRACLYGAQHLPTRKQARRCQHAAFLSLCFALLHLSRCRLGRCHC